MNKNAIKKFAIDARTRLKDSVTDILSKLTKMLFISLCVIVTIESYRYGRGTADAGEKRCTK